MIRRLHLTGEEIEWLLSREDLLDSIKEKIERGNNKPEPKKRKSKDDDYVSRILKKYSRNKWKIAFIRSWCMWELYWINLIT